MKQILMFLSSVIILSCSSRNQFEKPIKEYIIKNAMGVNIKPNIKEIIVLKTVTVKESIDDWYLLYSDEHLTKDSLKAVIEKLAEANELSAKEQPEKYTEDAKMWRNKINRIWQLENKDSKDIDYFVVKVNYTIKNPLLNNLEVNINRIFLFSKDYEIIASKDEDEFKMLDNEYSKTPLLKYEYILFDYKNSI